MLSELILTICAEEHGSASTKDRLMLFVSMNVDLSIVTVGIDNRECAVIYIQFRFITVIVHFSSSKTMRP